MSENQKEKTLYYYVEGNVQEKEKTKIKKKEVYFDKESKRLNRKSPSVIGITRFRKEKKKKDSIYIGNRVYRIDPIQKSDKIDGFFETSTGEYVAFYKESILFYILLPGLWAIALSLFLLSSPSFLNAVNPDSDPDDKGKWVIGGVEGTEVELRPEAETHYNTYWGYQEITVDKTMTVPFVNKETNTAYAQFFVYDKAGNLIHESVLIKPGTHGEWDAYSYYKGKSGEYLHDLKVVFYNPVYDEDGEILDFEASMFAANTPDFSVCIK